MPQHIAGSYQDEKGQTSCKTCSTCKNTPTPWTTCQGGADGLYATTCGQIELEIESCTTTSDTWCAPYNSAKFNAEHGSKWTCVANTMSIYYAGNSDYAGHKSTAGLEQFCSGLTSAGAGYCAGWGCDTGPEDRSPDEYCQCSIQFK